MLGRSLSSGLRRLSVASPVSRRGMASFDLSGSFEVRWCGWSVGQTVVWSSRVGGKADCCVAIVLFHTFYFYFI